MQTLFRSYPVLQPSISSERFFTCFRAEDVGLSAPFFYIHSFRALFGYEDLTGIEFQP